MPSADIPDDEAARLAKLRSYDILDTPPEPGFDDIARLASTICGTPIALISLIDAERQWFKSRVGLEASETRRDLAFCAHAIVDPSRQLIVQDTLRDQRFCHHPLVVGAPHIRFYAGQPLRAPSGEPLGSLCVISPKPGSLTADQQEALRVLADQVVMRLELRAALKTSSEGSMRLEESRKALHLTVEMLTTANAELNDFAYAAAHDLKAPLRVIDNATTRLEQDLAPHLTGESLENMQLIRVRVRRMNQLLDDLMAYSCIDSAYDQRLSTIVSGDILMHNILASLSHRDGIALVFDQGFAALRVRLMPLQLLLTKLIDNAIKHHDKQLGRIEISCQTMGRVHCFSVRDDGPGIRPEFHDRIFRKFQTLKPRDQVEGSGMGLAFVRRIVHDHGQTITLESSEGGGSDFRFTWPVEGDEATTAA